MIAQNIFMKEKNNNICLSFMCKLADYGRICLSISLFYMNSTNFLQYPPISIMSKINQLENLAKVSQQCRLHLNGSRPRADRPSARRAHITRNDTLQFLVYPLFPVGMGIMKCPNKPPFCLFSKIHCILKLIKLAVIDHFYSSETAC